MFIFHMIILLSNSGLQTNNCKRAQKIELRLLFSTYVGKFFSLCWGIFTLCRNCDFTHQFAATRSISLPLRL